MLIEPKETKIRILYKGVKETKWCDAILHKNFVSKDMSNWESYEYITSKGNKINHKRILEIEYIKY